MRIFCNVAGVGMLVASAWFGLLENNYLAAELCGLWAIAFRMFGAKHSE
jgi:hypothetical protein